MAQFPLIEWSIHPLHLAALRELCHGKYHPACTYALMISSLVRAVKLEMDNLTQKTGSQNQECADKHVFFPVGFPLNQPGEG